MQSTLVTVNSNLKWERKHPLNQSLERKTLMSTLSQPRLFNRFPRSPQFISKLFLCRFSAFETKLVEVVEFFTRVTGWQIH